MPANGPGFGFHLRAGNFRNLKVLATIWVQLLTFVIQKYTLGNVMHTPFLDTSKWPGFGISLEGRHFSKWME
jgi:hypothetical protein